MKSILKYPTKKLILLYLGATLMILGAIQYFIEKNAGIMIDKPIASSSWYGLVLRLHITCGLVAIFTGPTQIFEYFRVKNIVLHKRIGYMYTISVALSGLAGMVISFYAMGGWLSKAGLFALSLTWLSTLSYGIYAILRKNIQVHKYWLHINYGVTFAAVTQRLLLLFGQLMGVEFITLYTFTNWVSWIFNVVVVVWLNNRMGRKME
jgi:Predicted membrane protein (DUF2306)